MEVENVLGAINFFVPKIIFWFIFMCLVVGGYLLTKNNINYEHRYKLNYALVFGGVTGIYFGLIEKIMIYKSGAINCILYTERKIRGGLDPCMRVEWYGSNIVIYGVFFMILIITFLILRYLYKKGYFYY